MPNLQKYLEALQKVHDWYGPNRNRLDALNKPLHKFKDESTIDWTVKRKQKALDEAKAEVKRLRDEILPELEESLDMEE